MQDILSFNWLVNKANKKTITILVWFLLILGVLLGYSAMAGHEGGEAGFPPAMTFLAIAIILVAAKISSLVEKVGQPSVLGELVVGVVLGNLVLAGLHWFEWIKTDGIVAFLSELGVVILLFQIGLESNIAEMKKVGIKALLVATVGVVTPFVLGTYIVGPWILPGLSANAYIFFRRSFNGYFSGYYS